MNIALYCDLELISCDGESEKYEILMISPVVCIHKFEYKRGCWFFTRTCCIALDKTANALSAKRNRLMRNKRWELVWKLYIIKGIIGDDIYEYSCCMVAVCPWPRGLLF